MRLFACLSLRKLCGNGSKTNKNQTKLSEAGSSDGLTRADKADLDEPTQSDQAYLDDPTSSDKAPFVEPTTPSDKAHFDDPTTSNKIHVDDPTRMPGLTKFSLKEIKLVTDNFSKTIGEGFLGKIYEGQLSLSLSEELVDVAVRRLDNSFRLQEILFEKEISILTRFKHKNMVSVFGYCYENDEMLIISERVAGGSLNLYLNDPRLTWMRRLQISVGAVSALSYLHHEVGHDYSVVHQNINSDSILIDENWEAKLSGFEYCMTIPAGNLDLAYEKLRIGIYKSDIFSIGIVLFELLCGKGKFVSKDDNSFQASSAIFHYDNGDLHKFVDPVIHRQMDQRSFKIFSKIAYNCLIDQRAPPTMNQVLQRLERALKFQQMHENNSEHFEVIRTIPEHLKLKLESLKHMRIRLDDILAATHKFSKDCLVSSGGFGSVYIAELEHVDREFCLPIEPEKKFEVSKKRSKVAIKYIDDTEDEIAEQGFYAEIDTLTSCKHSNIITLVGFCDESGAMILVYEYASKGNLSYYIQNMKDNKNGQWAQRVKICLDAAKGLSFLHSTDGDRQEVVHRDIKSANILLNMNLEAKIGDFGLSIIPSVSEERYNTQYSRSAAGTPAYMDPQYRKDAKLKKESDVYSFGVVLFEILCGMVAYDTKYGKTGLAPVGRHHFKNGTIMEIVDPKIKEEISETPFASVKGPNQESLDTFIKIAFECLAEAQGGRPSMETVVKELNKALLFEENRQDMLRIPLEDISSATDFTNRKYHESVGEEYMGKVSRPNGNTTSITVKWFKWHAKNTYETELKFAMEHKHDNVINFLGYCDLETQFYLVYEHALNGSLKENLNSVSLTWGKRLKICIDIANGLDFLHHGLVTGKVVIHSEIRGDNILLDADMNAKIAYFGNSVITPMEQTTVSLNSIGDRWVGDRWDRSCYQEPEFEKTLVLSKECDIYSFGIVLFEILLQRSAHSFLCNIPIVLKRLCEEGSVNEMMYESKSEQIAPQSQTIFRRVAIQCLHDKREERPTASEVAIQLKQALEMQEKGMEILRISFDDIKCATDNFSDEKCLGSGTLGKVYKGQLPRANGQRTIAAKRWDGISNQRDNEFYQELQILYNFTHMNVVGLEGYCEEMGEKIILYEYAPNGSLDRWLNSTSLTWKERIEIGIDVANGLKFLHGDRGALRQQAVLHGNIKSGNILLSGEWKAKIAAFGKALISPIYQKSDYIPKELAGNEIDPAYMDTGTLSQATDIYSFGVVLFEILCGRLAHPRGADHNQQYLGPLAKTYNEQNKIGELVFEGIKEQIVPQSLSTFANIACNCLHDDRHKRPSASDVVVQLKKALELQVDWEMWESKLPSDYKEIFEQSGSPNICNTEKKEILYNMLYKGILIQKGKVWFWLDINNNRNQMISATSFTYQNQSLKKWRHIRKSRFERVPLMVDISNLKIQTKIKAQFLTSNVHYGVFLVFKFGEANKTSSEPMYVNLKYKKDDETLHAYYATRRDDNWMMIELYQFFNNEDACDFEFFLESFSRYYSKSGDVYVEGIEFRAIDKVKHEETDKVKYFQQMMGAKVNRKRINRLPRESPFSEIEDDRDYDEYLLDPQLYQLDFKRSMISAKVFLYRSLNKKLVLLTASKQSRFGDVTEVPSQQVIRIMFKFRSREFLPDIIYSCNLIFKLSENCRGLHCPVKVRDLLQRSNKETKAVYFRTPNAWNIHDINQVPKEREDGWMEVNLNTFVPMEWEYGAYVQVNLKLICYEGTMSGLIVRGLELRLM